MSYLKEILSKTEVMLLISIVLGLMVGLKIKIGFLIDYLLGIMMFFSIRPFFRKKFDIKNNYKKIFLSIFFNYIFLSGLFIIVGTLFFKSSPYYVGFILLAIVPPAISIVPLCYATKCEPEIADTSLFLSFALSLIIIPSVVFFAFKKYTDIYLLLSIMLKIIIVPLILAYLLSEKKFRLFSYSKIISNICLSAVLFIAVSLNRNFFLTFNSDTIKIYFLILSIFFLGGFLVYFITSRLFTKAEAINFTLYATQKNEGTALAISVGLFSSLTIIPVVIALLSQFLFFIFLKKYILKISI